MDPVQHTSRPAYDLARVKACTASGRYRLGGRQACLQHLEAHLAGEVWRYGEFAERVVEALTEADFHDSRPWPEPGGQLADEYGIALPDAILEDFGVKVRNWYVKLHLQQDRRGELVMFMSLHPLAFDMRRSGGLLRAGV